MRRERMNQYSYLDYIESFNIYKHIYSMGMIYDIRICSYYNPRITPIRMFVNSQRKHFQETCKYFIDCRWDQQVKTSTTFLDIRKGVCHKFQEEIYSNICKANLNCTHSSSSPRYYFYILVPLILTPVTLDPLVLAQFIFTHFILTSYLL